MKLGFVWIESEMGEWTVILLLPSLHEIVREFSPQQDLAAVIQNVLRAFLFLVAGVT